MNTPAEGGDDWRRFISRAFWPAVVLLLIFTFRSDIADRLRHITHIKTPSFEADVYQGRVGLAIRDVLRSVYERHDDPRRAELDLKSFDQLVQLFATLDLDRLAQKRVLWVNARPTEEDLDLANAFAALDVILLHNYVNLLMRFN